MKFNYTLIGLVLISASISLIVALPPSSSLLQSKTGIHHSTSNTTTKVLDLTKTPTVPRGTFTNAVNLSFFVPAFSLFALASQFMPQMFPSLTTTTTSKNSRSKRSIFTENDGKVTQIGQSNEDEPSWLENVISNGLLF